MRIFPLIQVDAFADAPFTGNPAAVMPLDTWLEDDLLLAIAAENNLSETAFYLSDETDAADYELRWFTPTSEVALCGHATLATGHLLLRGSPGRDAVRLRTRKAGVLEVRRDGEGYALDLPATAVATAERPDLLEALGLDAAEVFLSDTGAAEDTAIILLDNAEAVRSASPDFRALAEIHLMAIVTARDPDGPVDVVSRVFVPAWGIDEDPVTGSAHAALTPFWAERFGRDSFTAFQASRRGGHVACRLDGDRAVLGGQCVTVMEGEMLLPD